jgi:hypothetical protein
MHQLSYNFMNIFSSMGTQRYRKLNINLRRQPLSNQRIWFVAGLLLAFAILLYAAYVYLEHKKM